MMSEQDINDQFKLLWDCLFTLQDTCDKLAESISDLKLMVLIQQRGTNHEPEKPTDP